MSPIYSYKCQRCGWSVDLDRSFTDTSPAPTCGDCLIATTKVIHATPAIFKGEGWAGKK